MLPRTEHVLLQLMNEQMVFMGGRMAGVVVGLWRRDIMVWTVRTAVLLEDYTSAVNVIFTIWLRRRAN